MIKNYTSNSKQTFDVIQKCLIAHKANQFMFEYEENGQIKSLTFSLKVGEQFVGFRLPARVEKVEAIFYANKKPPKYRNWDKPEPLTQEEKHQAYRTAWANIRDWLTAQMALIDTEQVKIEEVFLPYAVNNQGKTYFEAIQDNKYQLSGGVQEGEIL